MRGLGYTKHPKSSDTNNDLKFKYINATEIPNSENAIK